MGKSIAQRSNSSAWALLSCMVWCEACGGHSSTQGATGDTGATGGTGATGFTGANTDAAPLYLQAFGGPAGAVVAQVLPARSVMSGDPCSAPIDAGACQLTSCQRRGPGLPVPDYGNFGPVVASVGSTEVPVTYDGYGYPTVGFPSSVALGTGGIMKFRGGDGVSVPAFDVSATVPGLAVMTSPLPTVAGDATVIDSSQDLSISWLPISIGQIKFELYTGDLTVGAAVISIACTFDGVTGSGVVPQAFLATLKTTSPTYGELSSRLEATSVTDGLSLVIQGYQRASSSAGSVFEVTLE